MRWGIGVRMEQRLAGEDYLGLILHRVSSYIRLLFCNDAWAHMLESHALSHVTFASLARMESNLMAYNCGTSGIS